MKRLQHFIAVPIQEQRAKIWPMNFSIQLFLSFLRRLHSLVGLIVGPFIIIASITGALYAIAFATENWFYQDVIFVNSKPTPHVLSEQVETAKAILNNQYELVALRPAASAEQTTRVLFSNKDLGPSQFRTLFIDPNTLALKGDMITYGSSGAMPFRTTVDLLHRDLLLGKWGRWYSELAASWLWLLGFTGLVLFIKRIKTKFNKSKNSYQKIVNFHSYLGAFCLIGLIMLSITGLTWSEWAGENISKIRSAFNWTTPSLVRELPLVKNNSYELSMFDKVANIARENGIDSKSIEIKPGKKDQEAWVVSEIEKSWPTRVDAVAVDPITMKVSSKIKFQEFSLMAKLTRWGIDLHMGSLFGLANQIFLVIMSSCIATIVISGYMIWFKRKGWKTALPTSKSLWREFYIQPFLNKILIGSILLITGIILPVFLISLVVFTVVEEIFFMALFYRIERS